MALYRRLAEPTCLLEMPGCDGGSTVSMRHHLCVDRRELLTVLDHEGVNPNMYSLDGGHPSEKYVLAAMPEEWSEPARYALVTRTHARRT